MLKKISYFYIPTIFSNIIGVFVLPIYTALLTPVQFGYYELILLFLNSLAYFFGFGWDSTFIRYYNDKTYDKKEIIKNIVYYRIITHILLIIVYLLLRSYIPAIYNIDAKFTHLLDLVVIIFIFNNYFNLLLLYLRSHTYSGRYAIYNILISITNVSLAVILLYKNFGISSLIYSQLVSSFLGFIFFIVFFFRKKLYQKFYFQISYIKEYLRFGLPLVPAAISYFLIQYSDKYFISEFLETSEVGLYSLALKIASIVLIFTLAFKLLWSPFLYKNYQKENAKKIFANIFSVYLSILFLAAFFVSVFAKEIFLLLSNENYLKYFYTMPLFMLSFFIYNIGDYFCIGIGIKKKNIYRTYSSMTCAIINIILNFVLIHYLQVIGVIIATIISFVLYLSYLMYKSQKLYYVPYNFPLFLGLNGLILLTILVSDISLIYRGTLFLIVLVIFGINKNYFLRQYREISEFVK